MSLQILVHCTSVSDGMFSDEAVVQIKDRGGEAVYFTVPRSELDPQGRLRAILLETGRVQLPTNYRDTVAVHRDALDLAGR